MYMYIQVNGLILIKCNYIYYFKILYVRLFYDFLVILKFLNIYYWQRKFEL